MIQTDLYSFSYKKGSLVPVCKKCGAEHFYKKGKNKKGLQKYQCRKCGFRFVWSSDLPNRRFFSQVMGFAVELYTSLRMGISLQGVADILAKIFNINVSREAIRQWVLDAKTVILRRENISTTWHADETYLKIKGKGFWLWIVLCADTKQVLSWHISEKRLFKDAKIVLQKALDIVGVRPEKIVTDGLFQYAAAIKKVMGWHWRIYKRKHIIDSGIGKNALIERLNREVKRRVRWFSTFQNFESANAFFGLWFYHYNQSRHPS